MTIQAENAVERYTQTFTVELATAPPETKAQAIQDAEEFLTDEVRSMDVGRLTNEHAAYQRLVERFGTPAQMAMSYLEQSQLTDASTGTMHWSCCSIRAARCRTRR